MYARTYDDVHNMYARTYDDVHNMYARTYDDVHNMYARTYDDVHEFAFIHLFNGHECMYTSSVVQLHIDDV
jgi:hypothetical protein